MGEIGLLAGQRAYFTAVVSAPGRILRIAAEQVHAIMDQELELSELILREFLVRHSKLTRLGSGLTLVGSRFDIDTRRLLEGVGVYYAATQMEAQACAGRPVVIVGGGNSAGQAALFLATCTDVHLVIRGQTLATSMSRYLVERIEQSPRIHVLYQTEVTTLLGDGALEGLVLRHNADGTTSTLAVGGLFVFIGATPSTNWLGGQLALDGHGFVLTGPDIPVAQLESVDHVPLLLETSRPGIFCVGDVRSRSVKRVATAIGEGSIAVRLVFDRLQPFGVAAGQPAARA